MHISYILGCSVAKDLNKEQSITACFCYIFFSISTNNIWLKIICNFNINVIKIMFIVTVFIVPIELTF